MFDDGIENYKGREAEWAALCAFDCIRNSNQTYQTGETPAWIESVWEFVWQTCEEKGVHERHPQ